MSEEEEKEDQGRRAAATCKRTVTQNIRVYEYNTAKPQGSYSKPYSHAYTHNPFAVYSHIKAPMTPPTLPPYLYARLLYSHAKVHVLSSRTPVEPARSGTEKDHRTYRFVTYNRSELTIIVMTVYVAICSEATG